VSDAEDALTALTRDLVHEIAAGMALELAAPPPGNSSAIPPDAPHMAAQANPWPPKRGAAAVHPQLGGHLITQYPGDTISGHAHAHVPRPVEPVLPDPREEKLASQKEELTGYKDWEGKVKEYHSAAGELERFAHQHVRQGRRLPPVKRAGQAAKAKPRKK
jgi:hypothetical protein